MKDPLPFMGVAMSMTAFPVLARIIVEIGITVIFGAFVMGRSCPATRA
jgi:hypothetical protein